VSKRKYGVHEIDLQERARDPLYYQHTLEKIILPISMTSVAFPQNLAIHEFVKERVSTLSEKCIGNMTMGCESGD